MATKSYNKCPLCSKERIVFKKWEEEIKTYIGTSTIVHTLMICPDPKCQKKVDADIASQKKRVQDLMLEKEERLEALKQKKLDEKESQ